MTEPIQLGQYGEKLYDSLGSPVNPENLDGKDMIVCIGIHRPCHGGLEPGEAMNGCYMDIHVISETHRAITCRGCRMRVVIPIEVKTYGDLRRWSFDTFGASA